MALSWVYRPWLLITWALYISVNGQFSTTSKTQTSFHVTIPEVVTTETKSKVCATLLNPNETLHMSIYLLNGDEKKLLHQETVVDKDFHGCFTFEAPAITSNSVSKIKVEVKGKTSNWSSESKIKMKKKPHPITYIQSDKSIYAPGQTMRFRVITMDTNFIPLEETYPTISLMDNFYNVLDQWVNVTSHHKIVQLSHVLDPEAAEGPYRFRVNSKHGEKTLEIGVQTYVQNRFDVTCQLPERVSVGAEELPVKICAKYTYDQPVTGSVTVSSCRSAKRNCYGDLYPDSPEPICISNTALLDRFGCTSMSVCVSELTQVPYSNKLSKYIRLSATVTEKETGIQMSKKQKIAVENLLGTFTLEDIPTAIEEGAVIKGKIRAVHFNGTGIAHKTVLLVSGSVWKNKLLKNLTTDADGVAEFTLDTVFLPEDLELIATTNVRDERPYAAPYYESAKKSVSRLRPASVDTPTSSSLAIKDTDALQLPCGKEVPITIKYTFTGETFDFDAADIIYMVLAKGNIVLQDITRVLVKTSEPTTVGEVSFKLAVSEEMAPSVQVVAYCVLPSRTVLADGKTFATEKCFKNKVSVEFFPSQAVPGEKGFIQLSALPGSICGLSAMDQRILNVDPEKRLDSDKVFELLPPFVSQPSNEWEERDECVEAKSLKDVWPQPGNLNDETPGDVFKRLGLKMITNLIVKMPDCVIVDGREIISGEAYYPGEGGPDCVLSCPYSEDLPMGSAEKTVRTPFPETWMWDLIEIGESGVARVPITVPDTITTLETEAFCLSPHGFGLAPSTAQLKVFKPFLMELSLPYSIIRGESFELKATVFNYLPKCIMLTLTPAQSSEYSLTPFSEDEYTSCVCANEVKTFRWTVVPAVLGLLNVTVSAEAKPSPIMCGNEEVTVPEKGSISIVTRPLLVKAEGTERMDSYSWLLCPKDGALQGEVDLMLPKSVVVGSASASVSVMGDILGRALKNIDNLLKMPYGTGEQNMAIISSSIYILQYLQNTGQLTPEIKEKAVDLLKRGYQRQLKYKLPHGGFSTSGRDWGNTWLTASVLRSLSSAKSFIHIDTKVLDEARDWLEARLQENGAFQMKGTLFNNRIKGGANDDIQVTSYVAASFLELNMTIMDKTMAYLKSSVDKLPNMYSTALLAYTFSLAGEEDLRVLLLSKLDNVATSEGSLLFWSQSKSEGVDPLAVETSSYVLLALLKQPTLTAADLGKASRIVNWLVKQQNPYGGFSSTQDTVVALQALALYATNVFRASGSSVVRVQSPDGDKHEFDVNQHNTLLYQERALQDLPGKYIIEMSGSTCASVVVAHLYNVPTPSDQSTFRINAKATPLAEGECNKANGQSFSLNITVQYMGPQNTTNMAILDVKMLSGFIPDTTSVEGQLVVERVTKKDDHVLLYLSRLPKDTQISFFFTIQQLLPVFNLKPAVVKLYDYYQPGDVEDTEYSSPCSLL